MRPGSQPSGCVGLNNQHGELGMLRTKGIILLIPIVCVLLLSVTVSGDWGDIESVTIVNDTSLHKEMNEGDKWSVEIVDTDEPLDVMGFKSQSEMEKYRNGEGADADGNSIFNVIEGTYTLEADENRVYYVLISLSENAESDIAYAQIRQDYELAQSDEPDDDSSEDSPFLGLPLIVISGILGLVIMRRMRNPK